MSTRERHSKRWLARELGVPVSELQRLATDPDESQYQPFLKSKPGRKDRPIDNPKGDLKAVQRRIRDRILVRSAVA